MWFLDRIQYQPMKAKAGFQSVIPGITSEMSVAGGRQFSPLPPWPGQMSPRLCGQHGVRPSVQLKPHVNTKVIHILLWDDPCEPLPTSPCLEVCSLSHFLVTETSARPAKFVCSVCACGWLLISFMHKF